MRSPPDPIACPAVVLLLLLAARAPGQIAGFPWSENFDACTGTGLPPGWLSTHNRSVTADDMTVSQTAPRSSPCCVAATNATVAQALTSPVFDFAGIIPAEISWYMRRSSTFDAGVILECSSDGGASWTPGSFDTLKPVIAGAYERFGCLLPRSLGGCRDVRLRWRIVPASTGSSGTLRFDDVLLEVHGGHDLVLSRVGYVPPRPRAGEPVSLTGIVLNAGIFPSSGYRLAICRACALPAGSECLGRSPPGPPLAPGDSAALSLTVSGLAAGINLLSAVIADSADSAMGRSSLEIDVPAAPGDAAINEIMYEPLTGEGEYVEIRDNAAVPLCLSGWRLECRGGAGTRPRAMVLPGLSSLLLPGMCAVAAEDSGLKNFFPALAGADSSRVMFPGSWETRLNNDGTTLLLADPWGNVTDSVPYSPSWHNPAVTDRRGRSLERILPSGHSADPANWSTCALPEGGTPARANSVSIARASFAGALSASPSPFSPDGDGREDCTVIGYTLPRGVWSVSVRIFDARGRLVRTLLTCAPSTGAGECLWDGRNDGRSVARMGIYVIYLEAFDESRLTCCVAKSVVVLARRLN